MANPNFDRSRAIRILVDAVQMGDAKACARWKITRRTLQNYRARLRDDPELAQAFASIHAQEDRHWRASRQRFLGAALRRARVLLKTESDLDVLSRAIERIGNLDVASEALNHGSDRADRESEAASAPSSEPGEDASDPGPVH